jgi:YbbR domain-containing protein
MLRLLVGQWQLKLLSLALAVGLWLFVASTEPREIMLAVPVEYIGLEGPLTLDGPRREAVDVQVHATRWAAGGVSPATVRVQVDVARLREGDNLVPLQPDAITVPAGVRVTRVAPGWVTVRLVRTATRSVRIVPRIQGHPAAAFVVGRVVVEPAVVQIKGPRTTIESRTAVETLPVDVSGRREAVTQTVGLELPESVVAMERRAVQVTVDIRPEETIDGRSLGSQPR